MIINDKTSAESVDKLLGDFAVVEASIDQKKAEIASLRQLESQLDGELGLLKEGVEAKQKEVDGLKDADLSLTSALGREAIRIKRESELLEEAKTRFAAAASAQEKEMRAEALRFTDEKREHEKKVKAFNELVAAKEQQLELAANQLEQLKIRILGKLNEK